MYRGKTFQLGCLQGKKADVLDRAQSALSGTYSPLFIRCGKYTGIVWREPLEYGYTYLDDNRSYNEGVFSSFSIHGFPSRDDAERALRKHLAQNTWIRQDGFHEVQDVLKSNVVSEQDRKNHLHWCQWQFGIWLGKTFGLEHDKELREYADKFSLKNGNETLSHLDVHKFLQRETLTTSMLEKMAFAVYLQPPNDLWQSHRKLMDDRLAMLENHPVRLDDMSAKLVQSLVKFQTIGQLICNTADDLLELKNFGMTSLNKLRDCLKSQKLALRGDE